MFAVIAEDRTDCDTIRTIAQRVLGRASMKYRSGCGCSKLRRKAAAWMCQLADEGVRFVIVLHDLDRDPNNNSLRDPKVLRNQLEGIPTPASIERMICIPMEELEAWFWADPAIIKSLGNGKGNGVSSPHLISCPKEKLIALSRSANGKPRYSTNDNPTLAKKLNLDLCAKRCDSFRELIQFFQAAKRRAA